MRINPPPVLVATLAPAIALAGLASASAASARPSASKVEHLRIISTKATDDRLSTVATGAFTAGGVDIPGRRADVIRFPGGAFRISFHDKSISSGFNPATCLITEKQAGTFTIGHGRGRYARLSGSGTYVTSLVGVSTRNRAGQCIGLRAPATFQGITTATGKVSR